MDNREKLETLRNVLDTLTDTCKSEISITNKLLTKTNNTREKSKLYKELAFWQGKLEVTEFIKIFTN